MTKVNQILQYQAHCHLIDLQDRLSGLSCESPIEELMAAHLSGFSFGYDVRAPVLDRWTDRSFTLPDHMAESVLYVLTQAPLGPYRVDFLVLLKVAGDVMRVAIECDGHDFHEKTKEQASRDKARDRFMQAEGIPVFRYTGSEIFRAPPDGGSDLLAAPQLALCDFFESKHADFISPRRKRA